MADDKSWSPPSPVATSRMQKIGHSIVSDVLGVDTNERYARQPADLPRRAYQTIAPATVYTAEGDVYLEREPTVAEWLGELVPTREDARDYVQSLFPSSSWIRRYCGRWLLGDGVAGLTIGLVVVPQAMAYALLAQLPPAYGLYTSFTGAVLYWLFGTSKDIVIGTTAVGSLLVGEVISHVQEASPGAYTNEQIAHGLSILSGAVMLFLGLLRLGWIIEFIPYIPISSFVTSASITIMCTQVPAALGIPDINTREAPYRVIIDIVKGLPSARLDAAVGVSSIVLLFAIRDLCALMEKRKPAQKRTWSFLSSLRMTFVMVLFTVISYLVNRNYDVDNPRFRIVGYIEPGFQKAGLPRPDTKLLGLIAPQLPAIVIILVIEHIAIAKAMGRLYDYTITPSQEIVALGAANMFSPFVGGYVCTGSFGASAVLSKAGVRTPLAGLFSACVLVLALYALTGVFRYIPNAALAGLIIHAVCNLLAPPKSLYRYWQLSPLELIIWVVGVAVAVFVSLETSIYVGIALSFILLLVRLARTRGQFLGIVDAHRIIAEAEQDDAITQEGDEEDVETWGGEQKSQPQPRRFRGSQSPLRRVVYVPLDRRDASNPNIRVDTPWPGVFVYRFNEGFNYTNQALHVEALVKHITTHTRQASKEQFERESDRLWNDPGPSRWSVRSDEDNDDESSKGEEMGDGRPLLRAVVLDFAAVNNMDVTSVQGLMDLRNALDRHCSPDAAEMHFAGVHNRWTRRALAASGFGYPSSQNARAQRYWQPAFTIASILDHSTPQQEEIRTSTLDPETGVGATTTTTTTVSRPSEDAPTLAMTLGREGDDDDPPNLGDKARMAALYGVDRPFFHHDIHDAVEAAVRDAQRRDGQLRFLRSAQ